jgi:hypothetical protein
MLVHPRVLIAVALLLLGAFPAVFADKASDAKALQAQCDADREAKIKPLRDAEIAKCKADPHNDHEPGYCERFWASYGAGIRHSNGTMNQPLFQDLPSCVAAFEALKALKRDGN